MNLSHRARLTLVSALATGSLLAVLFIVIYLAARENALGLHRAELTSAVGAFTSAEDHRFDFGEFHEAHPDLGVVIYNSDGGLAKAAGAFHPLLTRGFARQGRYLVEGIEFKGQFVCVASDLTITNQSLAQLKTILATIWLPLTLLVAAVTWLAAQAVFRPLRRLSAQAVSLGGDDLSARLDAPDHAEFGAFVADLNQMLDRIEETALREDRFAMDAAHELRTPLAILRTRLETSLLHTRSSDQYEETIRKSISEIERLTSITEALLQSAKGEIQAAPCIELKPVVDEILEGWVDRFESNGICLTHNSAKVSACVLPDELQILLSNLLSNCLRHAASATTVLVTLSSTDVGARVSVQDDGPGIPEGIGSKVFDRFVRTDDSRNRALGGAGIGLSVCRRIVTERGGFVFVEKAHRRGAEVGFVLPACS